MRNASLLCEHQYDRKADGHRHADCGEPVLRVPVVLSTASEFNGDEIFAREQSDSTPLVSKPMTLGVNKCEC